MNVVGLILALVAGGSFLAGAIQGLVAWHSADPQLQERLRPFIIGCILLTIALVVASYYSSSLTQITANVSKNPGASLSPTVTPTSNMTAQPTLQPTETPTMQLTPTDTAQPTDTPSPVPTLQPTPGPAAKAATLPFVMNCGCPSNPVQVRVTGVHIQQSLGRMTWDLTLLNVGTNQLDPEFAWLKLELNGQKSYAEGGVIDNNIPLAPNGQSGDLAQSTITFTFVPQQGTYTLTAYMRLCSGFCDTVSYQGQQFTFQ